MSSRADQASEFFNAIAEDRVSDIKKMLAKNPELVTSKTESVDTRIASRPMNWTPLHFAVSDWHPNTVILLLANDADTNATDVDGRTPLHVASGIYSTGRESDFILKLLVYMGANVNARDNKGRLPIHEAALAGFVDRVEFLNDHGSRDLEVADNTGMTVLDAAFLSHRKDIIDRVLQLGAQPNMLSAVFKGDIKTATALLRTDPRTANRQVHQITPLLLAISANNLTLTRMLLSRGANPNPVVSNTPLSIAVSRNDKVLVKLLLKYRANVNAPNFYNYGVHPINLARDEEMKKLLRKYGAVYVSEVRRLSDTR